MKYELIDSDRQVPTLLAAMAGADLLGMDTEFVAEDRYRPELCLLQISTPEQVFLVDPSGITQLEPVWQALLDPRHKVVVHAGREEVLFAYRAAGASVRAAVRRPGCLGTVGWVSTQPPTANCCRSY